MSKRGKDNTTLDDFLNASSSKVDDDSKPEKRRKTDEEIFNDFVRSQEGRFISNEGDMYIVSRIIKGVRKVFGQFTHYEYAIEYEHNLIVNGWYDHFQPSIMSPYGRFIRKIDNKFYIFREINGKRINFGSFYKLEPALLKREELIDDNWGSDEELNLRKKGKYGKYITSLNGKYEINKMIDGELYNFGYFDTLDDAKTARDILVENNWDDRNVPERLYSWRFFIRYHPLFKSWEIINIIGEDLLSFGLYEDVDTAKKALDILIDNDWDSSHVPLDYYHEFSNIRLFKRKDGDYYSVIRKVNDELVSFASFDNYDEALEFRNDLLMRNWIIDEEEEKFDDYIYYKDGKFRVKNNDVVYGEFDRICDAADFMIECVKKNWEL